MFSTFPDGWPGAGLMLLRAAVGGGLIVQGIAYLESAHSVSRLCMLIVALTLVAGALLLGGFLTRLFGAMAALASVGSLFSWFPCSHAGLFETPVTSILGVVIAIALVCLGGGAYSLDARLFGRREVIIPRDS